MAVADFNNEADILEKIDSPFTVKFYGALVTGEHYCFVTEFAPFKTLDEVVKMPNISNGNHFATFNECTLYNPKKSDYYVINDNCNIINGVIDNLIYDNLVTDSLVATIQEVQGEYDVINNSINIDNNFTIVYIF